MKITVKGNVKELAALVLALQERLVDHKKGILMLKDVIHQQQFESTAHEQV